MVVTRRVPSPRSVRHLLQVASVSASVVGKTVLYVKHGRSASSRASPRRELCVLERSNSVAGLLQFHSAHSPGHILQKTSNTVGRGLSAALTVFHGSRPRALFRLRRAAPYACSM